MIHVFIINPVAGGGRAAHDLLPQIKAMCKRFALPHEIYTTKSQYDATRFVKLRCEQGDELRVYACGGDGTLAEVASGAFGFSNVEVAPVACGSGNDFVRQFPLAERFADPYHMLRATARPIDMLRVGDKLCLNNVAIGIDSKTIANLAKFRLVSKLSGSLAYKMSLAYSFLSPLNFNLTITCDDGEPFRKRIMIALAANGQFYGGGFHSAPKAAVDDGLIDCLFADRISRMRFLRVIVRFKRGLHLDGSPDFDFIDFRRAKKVRFQSVRPVPVQWDGEYIMTTDITVEVVPHAIRLCVPHTAAHNG